MQGKPWAFTFVFLASIFILGGLTSASPAVLIGWSILYAVCDLCGYKKGEPYPTMMVFAIVFAGQVGMSMIPFKQVPLTVLGAFSNISGMTIDYAKYMLIAILSCVACACLLLCVCRLVIRPDVSKLLNLDASKLDKSGKGLVLTRVQKIVFGFLIALVLCMLLPSFLPKELIITKFLKGIGNTGICILIVAIMCFIKVEGKPLIKIKEAIDSGVAWSIIFLLAAVQPLSTAMSAKESGIMEWMIQMLDPIFGGKSPVFFMVVIGLIATLLTNVMNNGALGVALMPFIYSYCSANGVDPQLSVIIVVMCVHLAFLTPAASSSASLLHGNDWISTKPIMKIAVPVVAVSWAAVTIITLAIGAFVF